jgi:hypothetical protein
VTFVVFSTPTFARSPCIEYVVSMCQTQTMMTQMKIDHVTTLLGGDPYLAKVRNRLVGTFLSEYPKATDLFFLDDDIGWPPEKIIEFLNRPEDIVCGVYPKKQDAPEFPVTLELDNGQMIQKDGLFLAHLAPTGFMRIKRHVLEKLAARSQKYQEVIPGGRTAIFWEIFQNRCVDMQIEALRTADIDAMSKAELAAHLKRAIGLTVGQQNGEWWGEDYFFTQRWREMGGQVWVDPNIKFTHRGSKAWEADFGHTVRATIAARQKEAA